MTTILLDPGHGSDTPGKRSPDGHFREYAYNRYLAIETRNRLTALGLDARILVPEQNDITLRERCRRANAVCKEKGTDNVLLISIHINAAGNGSRWMTARGWSAYTTKGNTKSLVGKIVSKASSLSTVNGKDAVSTVDSVDTPKPAEDISLF